MLLEKRGYGKPERLPRLEHCVFSCVNVSYQLKSRLLCLVLIKLCKTVYNNVRTLEKIKIGVFDLKCRYFGVLCSAKWCPWAFHFVSCLVLLFHFELKNSLRAGSRLNPLLPPPLYCLWVRAVLRARKTFSECLLSAKTYERPTGKKNEFQFNIVTETIELSHHEAGRCYVSVVGERVLWERSQ